MSEFILVVPIGKAWSPEARESALEARLHVSDNGKYKVVEVGGEHHLMEQTKSGWKRVMGSKQKEKEPTGSKRLPKDEDLGKLFGLDMA